MNILLVDDDPLLSRLLTQTLRVRGHMVTCCENGAEAVLAHEGRWTQFDAVVSDVNMPQLDGVSLCKAIRDQVGKASLPVVLMSSLDSERDILRGLEAGADDYLVKPFRPSYLSGKLEALEIRSERLAATNTQELPLLDRGTPTLPIAFDEYVLEERIGEGGFSWVYGGRRVGDDLPVAIKILKPDQLVDRSTLARYFREVLLLSDLDCPYIVKVYGSGYCDGHYFIALERLAGHTAFQRLNREGRRPCAEVVQIGLAVSRALASLAESGLVHRDVKPANIILGPSGEVTLIDLGLAKAETDQGLTLPHELLGTADYLAPEVITGAPENIGSDCYALGVTLYELLTDAKPFGQENPLDILARVAKGVSVLPAREYRVDVPQPLSDLIGRLMHPKVERRLVDPREAARAFSSLAESTWMSVG